MIPNNVIREFQRRVDPQAIVKGDFKGISTIMYNEEKNITYFLHYIEEFWHAFGKYYPHIGGQGTSVAKIELEYAKDITNSMIVTAMPSKKHGLVFYGYGGKDWYQFCLKNDIFHNHTAIKELPNGSIPIKLLVNLEKAQSNVS